MPKRKKISLASEDSKDGSECSKQRKFLDPVSKFFYFHVQVSCHLPLDF